MKHFSKNINHLRNLNYDKKIAFACRIVKSDKSPIYKKINAK